jgi:hypothetical protein
VCGIGRALFPLPAPSDVGPEGREVGSGRMGVAREEGRCRGVKERSWRMRRVERLRGVILFIDHALRMFFMSKIEFVHLTYVNKKIIVHKNVLRCLCHYTCTYHA